MNDMDWQRNTLDLSFQIASHSHRILFHYLSYENSYVLSQALKSLLSQALVPMY